MGWLRILLLMLPLMALPACSGNEEGLDPALFAEDGFSLDMKRLFAPDRYWDEKVTALEGHVREKKSLYRKLAEDYRVLVEKRRKEMGDAREGIQGVHEVRAAKMRILATYRPTMRDLKEKVRVNRKELEKETALLEQARRMRARSRGG